MKIIQVATNVEKKSDGVAYVVLQLYKALRNLNTQVELHTLGVSSSSMFSDEFLVYPSIGFWRFGVSPKMLCSLQAICKKAQIIHNHGLWRAPNIYASKAKRGTNCKLITSPHGMLSDWALVRFSWKKKIAGWLGQTKALKNTDMFHATAEKELHEIRALGLIQPVAIIPSGVDMVDLLKLRSCTENCSHKTLLFLGRLHPVKGIDLLLRVWPKIAQVFQNWQLKVVGPIDRPYAKEILKQGKMLPRVVFLGELSGNEKFKAYADADIFVLPTFSENFGMTIAEALVCGTPVITTKNAPWSGLIDHNCGWWINLSEEDLISILRQAMSKDPLELKAMGARGRDWMARDFSWQSVGEKMLNSYQWLLGECDKPDWIVLD